jgi:hypothetical protein
VTLKEALTTSSTQHFYCRCLIRNFVKHIAKATSSSMLISILKGCHENSQFVPRHVSNHVMVNQAKSAASTAVWVKHACWSRQTS